MRRVIQLHLQSPPKPAAGAACNGCGVCCAAEPCPVGMLVSRRRHGACTALVWQDDEPATAGAAPGLRTGRYRCGLLVSRAPTLAGRLADRLARRLIAAGQGCDCDLEVEPPADNGRQGRAATS